MPANLVIGFPIREHVSSVWQTTREGSTSIMRTRIQYVAAKSLIIVGVLAICIVRPACADGISFQLSNSSLSTSSGGTVTFTGTITNGSGGDLNASDLFFNFANFDPASVTPTQVLPSPVDFLIPNGVTSGVVDLFDMMLGSVAAGSTFLMDVQLEDINNDLSAIQTVTVSVPGSVVSTPEPASFALTLSGLIGLVVARRRWTHRS